MSEERLIGHVSLDSGVLALGDPSRLVAGGSAADLEWQDVIGQIFDATNPRRVSGTTAVLVDGTVMTTTPSVRAPCPVFAEVDEQGQVLSLRVQLAP